MKTLKSLILEIEEPFEEPTTGWAAPENPKEKLLNLIPRSNLTNNEKTIILERLNGETLEEIGDKLQISKQRVKEILSKAIYKINISMQRYHTM
jgi:DNA-directed RNA polymerase sigma subunit (sigma70/sigma32)